MVEIKKIEIDGEIVHISKTTKPMFNKWHVVYLAKNEDGTINWKHLISGGTWWNLVFVILFIVIILGAALEYNHSLKSCTDAIEKLNVYESTNNQLGFNPLVDNMRLIPNITLEVKEGG